MQITPHSSPEATPHTESLPGAAKMPCHVLELSLDVRKTKNRVYRCIYSNRISLLPAGDSSTRRIAQLLLEEEEHTHNGRRLLRRNAGEHNTI